MKRKKKEERKNQNNNPEHKNIPAIPHVIY